MLKDNNRNTKKSVKYVKGEIIQKKMSGGFHGVKFSQALFSRGELFRSNSLLQQLSSGELVRGNCSGSKIPGGNCLRGISQGELAWAVAGSCPGGYYLGAIVQGAKVWEVVVLWGISWGAIVRGLVHQGKMSGYRSFCGVS